jgi:hypothetical protein
MNRGGLDHVRGPPWPRPLILYPMTISIDKDGVGISQSNGVTVFIPLLGTDAALCQSSPSRDRNLCIEVVVSHLWGHLKVAVVRVKVMVIIIEVIVRGQVFCWKILFHSIGSKVVGNSLIEYLHISWWIGQWISLSFRCRRVDMQTLYPFDLRILVVKAEPTLVAGPKYCP